MGLNEAGHNVGCVEPNNLTVNTRKLGESLKNYLIANGVNFTFGKKVRLIANNGKIKYAMCEDGEIFHGDKFVLCAGYDSGKIVSFFYF